MNKFIILEARAKRAILEALFEIEGRRIRISDLTEISEQELCAVLRKVSNFNFYKIRNIGKETINNINSFMNIIMEKKDFVAGDSDLKKTNYKMVDPLFGLTLKEIELNTNVGYYIELSRCTSIALTEIMKAIGDNKKNSYTISTIKDCMQTIVIANEMDKLYLLYDRNDICFDDGDVESAKKIHEIFMSIIEKVDAMGGIFKFISEITAPIAYIENKRSYEDYVLSCLCVIELYMLYERNLLDKKLLALK